MNRYLKSSKSYACSKCGAPFHFQIHRNWFMKMFSVFIPVRHYYCAKCKKGRYVVLEKISDDDVD